MIPLPHSLGGLRELLPLADGGLPELQATTSATGPDASAPQPASQSHPSQASLSSPKASSSKRDPKQLSMDHISPDPRPAADKAAASQPSTPTEGPAPPKPNNVSASGHASTSPSKPSKASPLPKSVKSTHVTSKAGAATGQTPVAASPSMDKPKRKNRAAVTSSLNSRPKISDGRVQREIWQPSDRNGDPTPDIIEKNRNRKTGHPSWRLFMGNVPAEMTDTNPPRYVYLDDKAAWQIHSRSDISKRDKNRFWPFDFTPFGKISVTRPNRGRPAYEKDGTTFASIAKKGNERYLLRGGNLPPADATSSAATHTVAESSKAASQETQSTSKSPAPVVPPEKSPPVSRLAPAAADPPAVNVSATAPSSVGPAAAQSPSAQAPAVDTTAGAELKHLTPPPSATLTAVRTRSLSPEHERAPSEGLQLTAPALKDDSTLNVTASVPPPLSSTARKRSASPRPASPQETPVAKRQRKGLQPYKIPPEVKAQDSEVDRMRAQLQERDCELRELREKVTQQKAQLIGQSKALLGSEKERDAFRKLAKSLYAHKVDQQAALADRHTAMLQLLRDMGIMRGIAERVGGTVRRELEPTAALHGDVEKVLDTAEEGFEKAGLSNVWEKFSDEAMRS